MAKEIRNSKIRYSETFYSAQGEGKYTGIPSLWLRYYMCNLTCDGFGQDDPTDRASYELPYETIDIKDITRVEDLPVFSRGCDSSYTWSRRYRHLMTDRNEVETVDELTALLPTKTFVHTGSGQTIDLVLTGGEPMMRGSQKATVDLLEEFYERGNMPSRITIETNGTQRITDELEEMIDNMYLAPEFGGYCSDRNTEWFWSISPKLFNTAGEKSEKAIKPEIVKKYAEVSDHGQLKFVVNGSKASWDELEQHVKAFRDVGITWPVYIMGVGGTLEGLKITEADIADEAIQRGYFYTTRAHVHLYGNQIGK